MENLSDEERIILAVEALEREVNNGGYDQFFRHSPEYASLITDALRRIGCSEVAVLTQKAIDALGIEGLATVPAINRVLDQDSEERDEKLRECDSRYYEAVGDLASPLLEFIKSHRNRVIPQG